MERRFGRRGLCGGEREQTGSDCEPGGGTHDTRRPHARGRVKGSRESIEAPGDLGVKGSGRRVSRHSPAIVQDPARYELQHRAKASRHTETDV